MPWTPEEPDGPGVQQQSELTRQKHPRGMYQHWLASVEGPADAADSTATFSRNAFARGVNALRAKGYSDDEIKAAFLAFGRDISRRAVKVRGRPAWLVFYGRKLDYLGRPNQKKIIPAVVLRRPTT